MPADRVRPEPEYPAGTGAGAEVPAPVSRKPDMNFENPAPVSRRPDMNFENPVPVSRRPDINFENPVLVSRSRIFILKIWF